MSEFGFFPIFLEKDPLKVDKILGLTFFQARKDFEGFKTAFFHLLLLSFVVDGLFTTPVYWPRRGRFVKSAFPNKKNLAQRRSLLMTNNYESKCLQKFTFQVNMRKNATRRRRLTSRNRIAILIVSTSCEERHNKPFRL